MIDGGITNQDLKYIYTKWGLTRRQKECITYYYLYKKTARQIADILDISHQMVSKHIKYAKKKAQAWLPTGHI